MRRALTFLAITGLSLASRHHSQTLKPIIPEDNKPVQVPYGAMDDELMIMDNARPVYGKPFLSKGKPVQVSHGAFDDDNEFRILFNPENPKPILQIPFRELNKLTSDDELSVVLGQVVKTPYLENQKKFQHIQFPNPKVQEGKPVEVPFGALDDEMRLLEHPRPGTHEPYINRPTQVSHGAFDDELSIVLGQVVKTPYLENQKKFQHIQFPNPIVQEGKPVQVPFGALDDEMRLIEHPRPGTHEPYINRPTQVSHGAFDDELNVVLGQVVKTPYLENQKKFQHIQFPNPIVQEGKPVQVPFGALDDEMRLIEHTRPGTHEPYINRPTQVSHGAFDDELHTVLKVKAQESASGSKRSFRPVPENYLENQKKFQYIQFPNPIVQEGKPVEVPYGAL